jgi:pyridoxal phosphate enzyme (YggS family)
MPAADDERIRRNVASVRARVANAAARVNRSPDSVRLVAVTKYADRAQIHALVREGCCDLAESRPQQLWERAAWFPDAAWHLVGHLQRNKVERTLPLVRWIHSVDSDRLLQVLSQRLQQENHSVSVLLQVNISEEASKHGWRVDDIKRVCESLVRYPDLAVRGFMGMASQHGSRTRLRREFRSLSMLSEQLRADGTIPPHCCELSMGMSNDFEIAVEEGATMIRVGSVLFEDEAGMS